MKELTRICYLLAAFAAIAFLPYIGAWIRFDGVFPNDYFNFPTLVAPEKAPFNPLIFGMVAVFVAAVAVLYIFPQVFGFKKTVVARRIVPLKTRLPVWFWVGLAAWGATLFVLWGKFSEPKWLINWADLPLFWGFALMLDGWVYVRTGGRSIIATAPRDMIGMGIASIFGWMIFEWLNFFVNDNWVYSKGNLIPDDEFVVYAFLGSSGLMPLTFQWYSLLHSFDNLRNRYTSGPRISLPHWTSITILAAVCIGLFFISEFPNALFGVLWVAPMLVLAVTMRLIGIRTPFTLVKEGNWTPLLLLGLTYLIQGFLLEGQNFFSGYYENGQLVTHNPGYWQYSIPYVDKFHIFEMPALGFAGYIPFGVYFAIGWIAFAWLLDIPARFIEEEGVDPFKK
ncbi:MAG: hypothetical protein DYG98_25685 [Haliscomenobacteraceae bacterium CHB4]|nr:hypothetical protein [Saprospiraceae bacterium]MCE7926452.1 hypothetical protein [Haliscomenobacteraceae bacterium CHB4]